MFRILYPAYYLLSTNHYPLPTTYYPLSFYEIVNGDIIAGEGTRTEIAAEFIESLRLGTVFNAVSDRLAPKLINKVYDRINCNIRSLIFSNAFSDIRVKENVIEVKS